MGRPGSRLELRWWPPGPPSPILHQERQGVLKSLESPCLPYRLRQDLDRMILLNDDLLACPFLRAESTATTQCLRAEKLRGCLSGGSDVQSHIFTRHISPSIYTRVSVGQTEDNYFVPCNLVHKV